jgi:hypothetical protein
MDADEINQQMEDEHWNSLMKSKDYTIKQINDLKNRKIFKEDVYMCKLMIKQKNWECDISCDFVSTYLKLSKALDGLNLRVEAINVLYVAHNEKPREFKIALALAKLLFRDDQKEISYKLCLHICNEYKLQLNNENQEISVDDAASAYYLAGWIKIHDDDHSNAYRIWGEGSNVIKSNCDRLIKQQRKRLIWDKPFINEVNANDDCIQFNNISYNSEIDFESFNSISINEPALSLFSSISQQNRVVYRSKKQLMTKEECKNIIRIVEEYHKEFHNGIWGTVRQSSVKTTDVAVEDIPVLRPWLLTLLHTKLYPIISAMFPILADGSTIDSYNKNETNINENETIVKSRMRVHDAFIVRYDSENPSCPSLSLPEHCDTSAVSVIVALDSEEDGDYCGGGTWFEALDKDNCVINAEIGKAVCFAGPLKHAGFPITKGCRNILVLFLYIEDYHYGPYLNKVKSNIDAIESEEKEDSNINDTVFKDNCELSIRPSGSKKNGFVVYRQTVELVNMLEESDIGT